MILFNEYKQLYPIPSATSFMTHENADNLIDHYNIKTERKHE